jgi:hypothetical protein
MSNISKLPKLNQVFFFLPNYIYQPVIKGNKIFMIYVASQIYNKHTFGYLFASLTWVPVFITLSSIIALLFNIEYWIVLSIFYALCYTPLFNNIYDGVNDYFYRLFKIQLKMADREAGAIEAIKSGDTQKFCALDKRNQIVDIEQLEYIELDHKLSKRIWPEKHYGTLKFNFKPEFQSRLTNGKIVIADPDVDKFSKILSENGIKNNVSKLNNQS